MKHRRLLLITALLCVFSFSAYTHAGAFSTKAAEEAEKGRLLIAEKDTAKAHIFSIAGQNIIQTLEMDAPADSLHTSPGGAYVLAFNWHTHSVSIYRSGLTLEDHGDHMHPYSGPAEKLPHSWHHSRPIHYRSRGKQSAIFFDGRGLPGNPAENFEEAARFLALSDSAIAENSGIYQILNTNMHGTAEVSGRYVLTVSRQTSGTPLPDRIVLFEEQNGAYLRRQTFTQSCPALHGSAGSGAYTLFACADGIVSIRRSGSRFESEKIPYPESMTKQHCRQHGAKPRPLRIGSFAVSPSETRFAGTACGRPYLISPASRQITPVSWPGEDRHSIISFRFTPDGKTLLLLDSAGTLHLLDTENRFRTAASIPLLSDMPDSGGHGGPELIIAPSSPDTLYTVSPQSKELTAVNLSTGKITRIPLAFTPAHAAWFGTEQ